MLTSCEFKRANSASPVYASTTGLEKNCSRIRYRFHTILLRNIGQCIGLWSYIANVNACMPQHMTIMTISLETNCLTQYSFAVCTRLVYYTYHTSCERDQVPHPRAQPRADLTCIESTMLTRNREMQIDKPKCYRLI